MHDYTEISPVIKIGRHRCVVLHSVQGCVMKWKIVLDVSRSWPGQVAELTASTSIPPTDWKGGERWRRWLSLLSAPSYSLFTEIQYQNDTLLFVFFCFRFMVLTRRICGVLNASGKKPVEDLLKFCWILEMLSFNWREESRALIKMWFHTLVFPSNLVM